MIVTSHGSLRPVSGTFEQLPVTTEDGTFPLIQIGQIIQKSPQLIIVNMEPAPQVRACVQRCACGVCRGCVFALMVTCVCIGGCVLCVRSGVCTRLCVCRDAPAEKCTW